MCTHIRILKSWEANAKKCTSRARTRLCDCMCTSSFPAHVIGWIIVGAIFCTAQFFTFSYHQLTYPIPRTWEEWANPSAALEWKRSCSGPFLFRSVNGLELQVVCWAGTAEGNGFDQPMKTPSPLPGSNHIYRISLVNTDIYCFFIPWMWTKLRSLHTITDNLTQQYMSC